MLRELVLETCHLRAQLDGHNSLEDALAAFTCIHVACPTIADKIL